jgi:hypothetical protein
VLREYARIAFFDLADLYDAEGNLLPLDQLPIDARRAITSIETEELFDRDRGTKTPIGGLRKIRFANKVSALDALAKHLGMLKNRESGEPQGKLSLEDARMLLEMWEQRAQEAQERAKVLEFTTAALDEGA